MEGVRRGQEGLLRAQDRVP